LKKKGKQEKSGRNEMPRKPLSDNEEKKNG